MKAWLWVILLAAGAFGGCVGTGALILDLVAPSVVLTHLVVMLWPALWIVIMVGGLVAWDRWWWGRNA